MAMVPLRQTLSLPDIQISYLEWNQGNVPLLLLHGLADHALVWSSLGNYLSEDYHIVAPDMRGHGESSKPDKGYTFTDAIADLEKPFSVGLLFVRGSRHRFDYINACQIVADLMVKHDWLEDDNADILNPYFLPYRFDKENPGVEIYV